MCSAVWDNVLLREHYGHSVGAFTQGVTDSASRLGVHLRWLCVISWSCYRDTVHGSSLKLRCLPVGCLTSDKCHDMCMCMCVCACVHVLSCVLDRDGGFVSIVAHINGCFQTSQENRVNVQLAAASMH